MTAHDSTSRHGDHDLAEWRALQDMAEALTNETLADRLAVSIERPRSMKAIEKEALTAEAITRLRLGTDQYR